MTIPFYSTCFAFAALIVSMNRRIQEAVPLPPLDETAYEGHETWTNKRWAWEFLRRNDDFKSACDALAEDATPGAKRALASKFGLAEFKHYGESFESKDGTIHAPRFISKAVFVVKPKRQDDRSWTRPVTIRPGQIAIRFDLRVAIEDDKILEEQVNTARAILKRQLDHSRGAKNITAKSGRNRPLARLLSQLRILDANARLGTPAQQAALVWGPGTPAKTLIDALDDAVNLAKKDYLLLAALGNLLPTRK